VIVNIDAHKGGGVKRERTSPGKKRVNNNAIKPKIVDPPSLVWKALTPGKNLSYPLPWIFNLCASMIVGRDTISLIIQKLFNFLLQIIIMLDLLKKYFFM
jgi:hypothetical protein